MTQHMLELSKFDLKYAAVVLNIPLMCVSISHIIWPLYSHLSILHGVFVSYRHFRIISCDPSWSSFLKLTTGDTHVAICYV